MKTLFLFLISTFISLNIFSQQLKADSAILVDTNKPLLIRTQSVGLDVAAFIFPNASINYERLFFHNKTFSRSLYGKIGYGYFLALSRTEGILGMQVPASIVYLGGSKNHFFEADLGAKLIVFDNNDFRFNTINGYPILNFGYRYQNPINGNFFKALLGTDGLTLGVGFAF